jgi:predicted nucleotidyltransferase component of viral defense system
MLSLKEIISYYPEPLKPFPRFILREYLQHKILKIIFDSELSKNFCFLGGTCLRIVHGNTRFSEDLDFDNFGMSTSLFDDMAEIIKSDLELEGLNVEIQTISRGAYHCYIRFPEILFRENLTGHRDEKILIQIDSEAQGFEYKPERTLLNKFDVFTEIFTVPLDILLSQKLYAILNRKRNKGRDFFDVVFLLAKTRPNYKYLTQKIGINSPEEIRSRLIQKCEQLKMEKMAEDVRPFLFNPTDTSKILRFIDIIKQTKFS